MTPIQLFIATALPVAIAFYIRKKERAARQSGYRAGWEARERHAAAHRAACPEESADEAFEAGYNAGKEIAAIRAPQTDDWKRGFEFGVQVMSGDDDAVGCDCPRCRREALYVLN